MADKARKSRGVQRAKKAAAGLPGRRRVSRESLLLRYTMSSQMPLENATGSSMGSPSMSSA